MEWENFTEEKKQKTLILGKESFIYPDLFLSVLQYSNMQYSTLFIMQFTFKENLCFFDDTKFWKFHAELLTDWGDANVICR